MSDSPAELFARWVLAVVPRLRDLPNGDGAFAAMSMTFGLYERFIDSMLNKDGVKASPANFNLYAAKDFGLGEGGVAAVERMWNGFRLGMQHAFQPKAYIEDKGRGDKWGWDISEDKGYQAYPQIEKVGPGHFIVTLDPWRFLDHTLNRWKENPELMNELSEFQFGKIEPKKVVEVAPAAAVLQSDFQGTPSTGGQGSVPGTGIYHPPPKL